jgi:hypothetical protein
MPCGNFYFIKARGMFRKTALDIFRIRFSGGVGLYA